MPKKQLSLLLPILAIWLLLSCTADKTEPDITPQNIKKIKKIIGAGPDDYTLYTYDSDGQLTNINAKWFNGHTDTTDEIIISYNQGKRSVITTPSKKFEYTYLNKTTTILTFHSLINPYYSIGTIKLNNIQQVIEFSYKADFPQFDSARVLFYYYPDGNIRQMDTYRNMNNDNALELYNSVFYESYDTKIYAERYLYNENEYTLHGLLFINNPTKVVDTSFFSRQKMVTTYQYQYDKDGYPINKYTQTILDGAPLSSYTLQYEYYQ